MSEVQSLAFMAVAEIAVHYFIFSPDGFFDNFKPVYICEILNNLYHIPLVSIGNKRVLNYLGKTATNLNFRKGLQENGRNKNCLRVVKGSDLIFQAFKIN